MGGGVKWIRLAQLQAALKKVPNSAGNFLTRRLLASQGLLLVELIVVQRRLDRHSLRLSGFS